MPATGLPKGDLAEYLTREKRRLVIKFEPRNKRINDIWDRRRNLRDSYVPEGYKDSTQEFHAPFVRDTIRRSQAVIGDRPPTPKVIPLKVGPEAQRNADKKELWLMAQRKRLLQREDTWGQITDAFANDAEVVWMKTVHLNPWGEDGEQGAEDDETFNKRTEEIRRKRFPFHWEHIPTVSYYPKPHDDDGLCEVFIVTTREDVEDIAEKYELGVDKDKKKLSKLGDMVPEDYPNSCEHVLWFNRTHSATMVDGEIVKKPFEHGYGRPPVFHAYFSTTSSKDPGFLTEGIADPIIELQDKIENFVTAAENYIWESAFPSFQVRPVSEDAIPNYNQVGKKEIVKKPGKAVENVPFGHILEPIAMPPIGQDLRVMMEFLRETLDRVSLARILYAELQGDTSGPVATSLIAMAKSIFGPGLNNLARAMDEDDSFTLEMLEKKIKHPVPVWQDYEKDEGGAVVKRAASDWMELGPDDINGYYAVENQLAPIIPLEQQQKIIQLTDGWERGLVARRRVQEEGYGITSPEKEDEEIEVDEYAKLEMYKQWVWSKFMERMQEAQEPMGQGTPPTPAVGPGGPVPQMAGIQQPIMPGFPESPMMPPIGPDPMMGAPMPMPMPMGGPPIA